MAKRLIITITKDSSGNEVGLQNMPIEAAASLNVFIDSLTYFAKLHDNVSDIRFSLENGSISSVLTLPEDDDVIVGEIEQVVNRESENNEIIGIFKKIQNTIQANGLEYTVKLDKGNDAVSDLTQVFKETKFAYRRPRNPWSEKLIFVKGRLFNAGGKSTTNLHVEMEEEDLTISCTQEEAIEVNKRLFREVFLVLREQSKESAQSRYFFVDSYLTSEKFSQFEMLYRELIYGTGLEKYDRVHDWIENILKTDDQTIGEVLKLMRLFSFEFSNRGIIRTILATIKPFRSHDDRINAKYLELAEVLQNRID